VWEGGLFHLVIMGSMLEGVGVSVGCVSGCVFQNMFYIQVKSNSRCLQTVLTISIPVLVSSFHLET
jgi:hypothetical protein